MTVQLSRHVQNCDLIGMLKFKLEQKECPKDDRYVLIKRLWNQHLFALNHPMTGSCSLRCNKTFCKMRRSNKAFVSNVCDIASRYVNTVMHLCYRDLSHTYQSGLNIVNIDLMTHLKDWSFEHICYDSLSAVLWLVSLSRFTRSSTEHGISYL